MEPELLEVDLDPYAPPQIRTALRPLDTASFWLLLRTVAVPLLKFLNSFLSDPFTFRLTFYLRPKREPALRWILGGWHSVQGRVHPADFLSATLLTSADEVTTHGPPS